MKSISALRFENAADMATALQILGRDAKALRTEKEPFPVVYVLGPDGTQFSRAILKQETLTDGSKVYHVELGA